MLRLLLLVATLWIGAQPAPVSAIETSTQHPEIERIQQRIEQLGSRTDPDAERLLGLYRTTLEQLQITHEHQREAQGYAELMQAYPARIAVLQRELIKGQATASSAKNVSALELTDLQQRLALANAELVEQQSDLSALGRELNTIDSRSLSRPTQLAELKQRLSEIKSTPPPTGVHGELAEAQQRLHSAQQDALSAQIKALELEQLSSTNRRELAEAEHQLSQQRVERIQVQIQQLQEAMNERRRQDTERTIAEASRPRDGASDTAPPLIEALIGETHRLTEQLKTLSELIAAASRSRAALEGELRALEATQESIRQQLSQPHLSSTAGSALRSQLAALPDPRHQRGLRRKLSEAQLAIYQLEQQAAALVSVDEFAIHRQNRTGRSIPDALRDRLAPYVETQRELTSTLLSNYSTYVGELAQLDQLTSRFNRLIDTTRSQIGEQLIWLPNTLPISAPWVSQVYDNARWLISRLSLGTLVDALLLHPERASIAVLLIVGAAVIHRLGRRRLPHLASTSAANIGKVTRDRFFSTLYLMLAISFYALPLPLVLLVCGKLLRGAEGFSLAAGLGRGLEWSAALVLLCRWIHLAAAKEGLFQHHFSWAALDQQKLRQRLRQLQGYAIPLLLLIGVTEHPDSAHLNNGLGRIGFILLCVVTAHSYIRLIGSIHWARLEEAFRHPQSLRRAATLILPPLPLVFALLAGMGYYYTGIQLLLTLQYSLLILLAGILLYAASLRWLLIEERRMAFNRAKARRADTQAQRQREDSEEERSVEAVDENLIDLETVSDHAKVALRTLLLIGVALSIGWIWSDLFQALTVLDQITLWQTPDSADAGGLIELTLKEFVYASAVLVLTMIAVRNLPGVMEILVLQHLSLAPGSGYAITTLLKYLLVTAGVLFAFNLIGFEWAKLQWLVAALGVGLGFGLQEIFANFVSGLILLFERPIRIGDTVTINDLTGTVTKIQIRATTIVDWNRKEIIVPNKAFITSQLVNWSLSDAITRLVINVGVAYGSDNKQVTQLLLEAAAEVPQVLATPKPEAYLVAFGASTMDYELRLFVNDMSHRLPVTHEVHQLIAVKFRHHGIEIAFPQMDVHLHRR